MDARRGAFTGVPKGYANATAVLRAQADQGLRQCACANCDGPPKSDKGFRATYSRSDLANKGFVQLNAANGAPLVPDTGQWQEPVQSFVFLANQNVGQNGIENLTLSEFDTVLVDGNYAILIGSWFYPPVEGPIEHLHFLVEQGPICLTRDNLRFMQRALWNAFTANGLFERLDERNTQDSASIQSDLVGILADTDEEVTFFAPALNDGPPVQNPVVIAADSDLGGDVCGVPCRDHPNVRCDLPRAHSNMHYCGMCAAWREIADAF